MTHDQTIVVSKKSAGRVLATLIIAALAAIPALALADDPVPFTFNDRCVPYEIDPDVMRSFGVDPDKILTTFGAPFPPDDGTGNSGNAGAVDLGPRRWRTRCRATSSIRTNAAHATRAVTSTTASRVISRRTARWTRMRSRKTQPGGAHSSGPNTSCSTRSCSSWNSLHRARSGRAAISRRRSSRTRLPVASRSARRRRS